MKFKLASLVLMVIGLGVASLNSGCAVNGQAPTTQQVQGGFDAAYNIAVGLDTSACLALTTAYGKGQISASDWVNKVAPAQQKVSLALTTFHSAYSAAISSSDPNATSAQNTLNAAIAVLQSLANAYIATSTNGTAPPAPLTPPPPLATN